VPVSLTRLTVMRAVRIVPMVRRSFSKQASFNYIVHDAISSGSYLEPHSY
jgi:hypothetical protein